MEDIDTIREELTGRIDETNRRLDRLFEVVVKREEYGEILTRLSRLEVDVDLLKRKIAV